jgi:hypothetical protein
MKLAIIPQGLPDGACLLYSLLNCQKTLIDPELTIHKFFCRHRIDQKWKKLVSVAPVPISMFNGDGSDPGLPRPLEIQAITNFVELAFQIMDSRQHRFSVRRITLAQFRRHNEYHDTAIIFCLRATATTSCYDDAEHWLCANGRQEQTLLLACSCAIYHCEPYTERWSDGRPYNLSMGLDQLTTKHIEHQFIYLITHQRKGQ